MKKKRLIVSGAAAALLTTAAGVGILAFKKIRQASDDSALKVKSKYRIDNNGEDFEQSYQVKVGNKRYFNIKNNFDSGQVEILVSNPEGELMERVTQTSAMTSLDLKEYILKDIHIQVTGNFKGRIDWAMSRK